MRHTLNLPDGRQLVTHSTKRWHVLTLSAVDDELVRYSSSDTRSRAIASWRELTRRARPAWVVEIDSAVAVRTPDDPHL